MRKRRRKPIATTVASACMLAYLCVFLLFIEPAFWPLFDNAATWRHSPRTRGRSRGGLVATRWHEAERLLRQLDHQGPGPMPREQNAEREEHDHDKACIDHVNNAMRRAARPPDER